jgi:hypothetical protein
MTNDQMEQQPRKSRFANIDIKGWMSILIGACAVWIAYESFVWQRDQAEGTEPTEASPENIISPGQHSTNGETMNSGSNSSSGGNTEDDEDKDKDEDKGPGNKGNKDKKH